MEFHDAVTARQSRVDIVTILLGFTVGASTRCPDISDSEVRLILGFGALSFIIAAMAPNVDGVIGSAIAARVFWSALGIF